MIKKFAATAMLAIAATAITAGTAHAQPGVDQATGIDQGMSYTTGVDAAAATVTTVVDGGHFELSDDSKTVTLFGSAGAVTATLPMAVQVAGTTYPLAPHIDQAGRSLALTPIGAPALSPEQSVAAQRHFVDAAADLNRHQYNAGVGALIGLGIGAVLGLGVLSLPFGAIGAGIGAIIGWVLP
ncbi:hypothetical protein [Nocardia sp. NPDC056100]|uniref:hypothetical protein n=1 Tax=Nocardia sp. NPDC056100 TaxID=3345712 RepID=UPI0035DD5C02